MDIPDTVVKDLKALVKRSKSLMIALGISRRENIKTLENSTSRKLGSSLRELSAKLDVLNMLLADCGDIGKFDSLVADIGCTWDAETRSCRVKFSDVNRIIDEAT